MQKKTILLIFGLLLLIHHELKAENIVYPENLQAIVDVTKPPYSADNSGKSDCTAVLIRAINDIIKPDRRALLSVYIDMRCNNKFCLEEI
jgi:hypothetical protein